MQSVALNVSIVLLIFIMSASLRGGAPADAYIQKAKELDLTSTERWLRVLFYQTHGVRDPHGLIDDPKFYLAANGKFDAQAEIESTLVGMFQNQDAAQPDEHIQCRFPGRKSFLVAHLPGLAEDLPKVSCPRFDVWWKDRNYESMSLVFSSFYPDNPASMFGHIFLRLHRTNSGQGSDLLDDSINFSAFPDTSNPLLFNLRGVFGGFPGRFSLLPYYMKIQEYNNLESRDLWEYPLAASQLQIRKILLSLWEFGPHHADYYYFDDNCSYVLLKLLETGEDGWDFTAGMRVWATPTSCLKAVLDKPDFVQGSKFRPSALSRYQERFDSMSLDQQASFKQFFRKSPSERLVPLASVPEIDAALDYIDFQEKLAGTQVSKRFASLRDGMLLQRSQIKEAPRPLARQPADRNPKQAVPESWLMLSGAAQGDNHWLRLGWQPVLHDLLGESKGYADDMQIQIMPMSFSYAEETHRLALEKLDVINVISMQPHNRLLQPKSWMFQIGWDRRVLCMGEKAQFCPESVIAYSQGLALPLTADPYSPLWAGFMSFAAGARQIVVDQIPFFQAGPEIMVNGSTPWSQSYTLRSTLARRWNADGDADWYARSELQLGMRLGRMQQSRLSLRVEDRLAVRWQNADPDLQLGFLQYF